MFFKIVYYSGDPVFVHLHGLWRNQWISDATGTNSSGREIVCFGMDSWIPQLIITWRS